MKNIVTSVVLASLALLAEDQTRADNNVKIHRELRLASTKLLGLISLDKASYFPGEEIRVTVTFSNPEKTALRVINPFNVGIGSVFFIGKGFNPMQSMQSFSAPAADLSPLGPDEVTTFSPGEVKTMTFDSSRPGGFASAPKDSGPFRIVYRYLNLEANFEVREAAIDSFVEVVVPAARTSASRKRILEKGETLAQHAFTLKDSEGYQLCVQVNEMVPIAKYRRFQALRTERADSKVLTHYLAPFRCLETSPTRITEIDLSFGNDGTMLVIGKREGASMLSFRLNEANKRIP